jgi:hypothetical protein
MLAMLACSEPVEVEPLTYSEIITGETKRAWSIRSLQLVRPGKADITYRILDCEVDDLYVFYNNPEKTFQVLIGQVCNEGDPQIAESSWSFVNATSTLTMLIPLLTDPPYGLVPFVLKEIDDQKMVLDVYLDDQGTAYRINFQIASLE